ncbi:MAG TPA: tetratricopeptide repeat protein [Pyrinomonadaceae bacterium]|nr:tetratricopeptide repeat protein [Pyrinomonadaceae bacterium]
MKIEQLEPSDEELRVILESGFALRYARRLDEAAEIFHGMVALLPEEDVPRVALGTVEIERGRFDQAQVACEEALRHRPQSLYARVHRAEALLFQQQREEAESELHSVIAANPESPHSRTARAMLEAANLICPTSDLSIGGSNSHEG